MNPADLGYYERRAGSGLWYRPANPTVSCEPRVCARPSCGREFMGRREQGRGRFCSKVCAGTAKRRDGAGYTSLHQRVYTDRGQARDRACVDCGSEADQWSQAHGTDGTDSFKHYAARCHSCHRKYDAKGAQS